ncbi:CU044_5270 family protein [Streptomyces sp. NPDC001985]|uniref:CU044_5270 family protein n=1 Tax=Streptomyces sp. NPDC001985 TaxID=3154406 RepID=UPI003330F16B
MRHDVLRRLAAARPAHLDPEAPAGEGVRERELAAAMAGDRATHRTHGAHGTRGAAGVRRERTAAGTGSGRTGPGRLLSPRWGIGLASAATAAVLGVTLLPAGDGGSSAPGTARDAAREAGQGTLGDGASGGAYLLAAAERQEAGGDPAGDGAFWYQKERHGAMFRVPGANGGPGYVVDDRYESREWLARDANRRWSRTTGIGARPASLGDERAWRQSGAPRAWDVFTGFGKLRHEASGLIAQDAPGGSGDTMPMGEIQIRQLRGLPTDVEGLRERLHELVDEEYNAPARHLRELVAAKALEIAVGMPAGPELRAAAYRLLAAEPGVRALGEIKDRSGRPGYGVALPSPGGIERRIVLDKRTGAPLGTLTVATRDDHDRVKGEVIEYTTHLEQSWTDTPPPFDRDEQPEIELPYDPENPRYDPAKGAPEPGSGSAAPLAPRG